MKTTLHLTALLLTIIISATSCGNEKQENTDNKKTTEVKPQNNTLANEALKGPVKTYTVTATKKGDGSNRSSESEMEISHFNKEGFITLHESFSVTDGQKKLRNKQEYIYNNGLLETVLEKDAENNIAVQGSVIHFEGKRILTFKKSDNTSAMKFIYSYNPSFSLDTVTTIIFNDKNEIDFTMYSKYQYNENGTRKGIVQIPEINGKPAGLEYSIFANYDILEQDEMGNPLKYVSKVEAPDGETNIDTITYSFEYYQ